MALVDTIVDIDKLLRPDENCTQYSIHRIPYHMKDENPRAYTPLRVSIGPYHFGAPHLAAMQAHKSRSLQHFLARTNTTLEDYIDALAPFTDELLNSYQLLEESWRADPTKFLKLMVLDGVFLGEFLSRSSSDGWDYDPKDPVFNLVWERKLSSGIMRDVMMMENQIPLTVTRELKLATRKLNHEKLVESYSDGLHGQTGLLIRRERRGSLSDETMEKFSNHGLHRQIRPTKSRASSREVPVRKTWEQRWIKDQISRCGNSEKLDKEVQLDEEEVLLDEEMYPRLHFLDIFRTTIIKRFDLKSTDKYLDSFTAVKSASELLDAGVQFRVSTRGISFEGGTLNHPLFRFVSSTETVFLNVIAFEKLHPTGREVSSYVAFMQGLISSARDVSILKSGGLIEIRSGGRNEDILNMMNNIAKDVSLDPYSELCEVRDSLNEYYAYKMKSRKHRMKLLCFQWWQNLLQAHFKSPWTILSLLAATVLLLLTLLQTIYTMKSYYNGISLPSS